MNEQFPPGVASGATGATAQDGALATVTFLPWAGPDPTQDAPSGGPFDAAPDAESDIEARGQAGVAQPRAARALRVGGARHVAPERGSD